MKYIQQFGFRMAQITCQVQGLDFDELYVLISDGHYAVVSSMYFFSDQAKKLFAYVLDI